MGQGNQSIEAEELSGSIRVSIRREDPATGRGAQVRLYEVQAEREMTVLEVLQEVYDRADSTLAFRHYRCGRRLCRSCEVKLDGKIVRGCAALLQPGGTYLLEAAHPENLIRDLVFEFDPGEGSESGPR
jgi:succinate dehydrogenase/fumarate reductase-like Fe-S protein